MNSVLRACNFDQPFDSFFFRMLRRQLLDVSRAAVRFDSSLRDLKLLERIPAKNVSLRLKLMHLYRADRLHGILQVNLKRHLHRRSLFGAGILKALCCLWLLYLRWKGMNFAKLGVYLGVLPFAVVFIELENLSLVVHVSVFDYLRHHLTSKSHLLRLSGNCTLDVPSVCKMRLRGNWTTDKSCMRLAKFIYWFHDIISQVFIAGCERQGLLLHELLLCRASDPETLLGSSQMPKHGMRLGRAQVHARISCIRACSHSPQVFILLAMPSNRTARSVSLKHSHRSLVPAHKGSWLSCVDCTLDPVVLVRLELGDIAMRQELSVAWIVHLQILLVCLIHHIWLHHLFSLNLGLLIFYTWLRKYLFVICYHFCC